MQLNRNQFLEDGYLVLRNVIPSDQIDDVRTSYERLLTQQREIWARDRQPDGPPGGSWEISAQPRLAIHRPPLVHQIDEQSATAVEIWLHETISDVSSALLDVSDAAVTEMMLMCNPVRDHGPAKWHRDHHSINTAPLQGYLDDILESGPRYIQWNIPLYDDDVLWVMPGSHLRLNSTQENQIMSADPRIPLPGGVQTHLAAGDGVVYILPILHWASNYSTTKRRTIHGGFSDFFLFEDTEFIRFLSDEAQNAFARWSQRSRRLQDETECALRAVIQKDGDSYTAALDRIHPGRGEKARLLSTVFLCKAAVLTYVQEHPNCDDVQVNLKMQAGDIHPITLNWGPTFSNRFSPEESKILWQRFKPLDALLQTKEEHFVPGLQQSSPMIYSFNKMPADYAVADFIAGWGADE